MNHIENAETLAIAKIFLEEAGWCQDNFEDAGKVCSSSAIRCASGTLPFSKDPLYAGAACGFRDALGQWPISFNDVPGRTKAQVLRAFDKAIKRELKLAAQEAE